jgi:hypothetical protein
VFGLKKAATMPDRFVPSDTLLVGRAPEEGPMSTNASDSVSVGPNARERVPPSSAVV